MRRSVSVLAGLACGMAPIAVAAADEAQNKATVKRAVEEIWNRGELAVADEVFATAFVRYGPTSYATLHGIKAFREYVTKVRTAYPDLRVTIEELVADGDKVMDCWTFRGTNTGPGERPPTGRKITVKGTSITRFVGGKIVEVRASWDVLDAYRQLGIDPPMDQREQNMAMVRRAIETVWNKGDLSSVAEFYASTYVGHSSVSPEVERGLDALKESVTEARAGFPDLYLTFKDMVVEGDKVVSRWTATGTHKGEWRGIAPTGKQMTVHGITIDRLADGKIQESWSAWDRSGLLKQLGVEGPTGVATTR